MRPCEMSQSGLLEVLKKLKGTLDGMLVKPVRFDDLMKAPNQWQQMSHASQMLDSAIELAEMGMVDRANRWLGFIEGLLWAGGLVSTLELRNLNQTTYSQEVMLRPLPPHLSGK